MKYIDAEKLKDKIKSLQCEQGFEDGEAERGYQLAIKNILDIIDSLQQEQPIEGKQVVIITETDGDANIHWDCRSLDDVIALLKSAESFIADKQVEELRGIGSGPDYNTTEGRFRNAHKFQQEQPEMDLEKEFNNFLDNIEGVPGMWHSGEQIVWAKSIAKHFFEFGIRTRKEEVK